MAPTVTTPLLPISADATAAVSPGEFGRPLPPAQPQETIATRAQRIAISTFSLVRFLRGLSLVVYPRFGLYVLDVPSDGSSCMLASLIGVRDILLAGLLHTADLNNCLVGDPFACREVGRALAVNLLSDAIDAFVLIFYAAWSSDWGNPLTVIIITAVMAILEHLTLWSLSEDEWEAIDHRSLEEDKVSRMNAWLRDLRRYEQAVPESTRGGSVARYNDSITRYNDMV